MSLPSDIVLRFWPAGQAAERSGPIPLPPHLVRLLGNRGSGPLGFCRLDREGTGRVAKSEEDGHEKQSERREDAETRDIHADASREIGRQDDEDYAHGDPGQAQAESLLQDTKSPFAHHIRTQAQVGSA